MYFGTIVIPYDFKQKWCEKQNFCIDVVQIFKKWEKYSFDALRNYTVHVFVTISANKNINTGCCYRVHARGTRHVHANVI